MESKTMLIIYFLTVTTILFSGCRAHNLNNVFNNIEGTDQCECKWNVDTATVPDIIYQYNYPTVPQYKRQIIYLYYDLLTNVITINIPNRFKQKLIPDVPIQPDDVLLTLTNETVKDLIFKNPEHATIENVLPLHKATETENIITIPKHNKLYIKPASHRHTTDEDLKPINPIISYPYQVIPNSYNEKIPKIPSNKAFRPGSSNMNIPHSHSSDTKLDDFGKQEPVVPNYYNDDLWHKYQVPQPNYFYPSNTKPDDFGKQEYFLPDYDNSFWPGSQVSVPNPHYLHQSNTKSVNFDKQEPVVPNYYNEGLWPEPQVSVPRPHFHHPSNTKPDDFGKQEPIAPIDFSQDYWPDSHESQPNSVHPSHIKSVDSGKPAIDQIAHVPHLVNMQPNEPMPNVYKHRTRNPLIHPDYTGIQRPCYKCKPVKYYKIQISPYVVQNQYAEQRESFNTVPFSKQKPVAPIHFDEDLLQPSDIKPVDSGKQDSSWSVQVPDSHVFHPSEIKQIDYDDREPKYSIPPSYNLHTIDIKPNDFGVKEPGHSTEAPSGIKLVDYYEKESDHSEEAPHSEHLHPSDIISVDFNEKESDHSEEASYSEPVQQSDIKPVYIDEKEFDYSEEIPHSDFLQPNDIKPVDFDERESGHSVNPDALQSSDNKLVDSDEKDFYYSEEIPYSESLQPSDIKPVDFAEKGSDHSEEKPHSDHLQASDNKLIDSDEKDFYYTEDKPHSDSVQPSDTKPVYFNGKEFGHYEETPHSHPHFSSDIKLIGLNEKESGHYEDTPHSNHIYPSKIEVIDSGKKDSSYSIPVTYPTMIQRDEPKIESDKHRARDSVNEYSKVKKPCIHCKPMTDNKIQNSPYIIPNQYPRELKWPIKLTTNVHPKVHNKIPVNDLTDEYKQTKWNDPSAYIGYKTFDQWFREEMRKFKDNKQKVNISSVGRLILKILYQNGMFVTNGGVLKDSQGRILYLQNFKLRPILIGDSLTLDKLFEKDSNINRYNHQAESAWAEYVVLNTLLPPRALGVIPLGTTFLPASHSLSSLYKSQKNSKFRSEISKKMQYDTRFKRHQHPEPLKITEPENTFSSDHKLDQNMKTYVSKDGVHLGHDESVESFLNEMPHYSLLKKGYVERQDNPLHLINKDESRMTLLEQIYARLKYGERPKHPHLHNQNNAQIDNDEMIRIIGGTSAMGSGHALNNKGRSGNTNKPNNTHSHNHGSDNPKKHYHDYINWEDLYRDDSLVRIIGGNAATGSGYPLSNKGRSGASY